MDSRYGKLFSSVNILQEEHFETILKKFGSTSFFDPCRAKSRLEILHLTFLPIILKLYIRHTSN